MPFKRSPVLLLFISALFTLVSFPVFAGLFEANDLTAEQQIDALIRARLMIDQRQNTTWSTGTILTSDYAFEGDWAFGMAIVTVPADIHGEPDLRLFLAKRDKQTWSVALEYTPEFYTWANAIPDTLIGFGRKQALKNAGLAFTLAQQPKSITPTGNPDARLSLPYATGSTWWLLGGPHGNNGDGTRPWSALDLNPDFSSSVPILAARDGYVYRSAQCPNYVRVDHSNGWQTGYYHVKNEQVQNGDYVERGTHLGYTSQQIGCGGWASGPHVHFTLKYNGAYVNIDGHDVGGWTVQEGNAAYEGCMRRLRDGYTQCKPGGLIYNDGAIGSGYFDRRYHYNGDNTPDLWAVNQRDAGSNSVSIRVASGSALGNLLLNTGTGMPQQPDWLNTAFASADYDGDDVPDLWVIHRWDGAEKTAFRVMSGAQPQYLIADEITALPVYDNSISFAVADYTRDGMPDLWAITPRDASTNSVSVRIVNGSNPTTVLAFSGTPLAQQSVYADTIFAAADYDVDGTPDLWAINPHDYSTKTVSVKVISGEDWSTTLVNKATSLPTYPTDIYSFSMIVADYNNDSYPDLWAINRLNNTVQIVSGKDLTTSLLIGTAGLPASNTPDWQLLGSDRARESIAPQAFNLKKPAANAQINDTTTELRWKVSGLAQRYTVSLYNASGGLLVSKDFSNLYSLCIGKFCRLDTAQLGYMFQDNQTYQWDVTAYNAYGSVISPRGSFTTDIPGVPTLIAPAANSTTTDGYPLFQWQPRLSADKYKLVIKNLGKTAKFKFVVDAATACTADLCSRTLPEVLPADTYTWKVIAKATLAAGSSTSAIWTFTVPMTVPTATAEVTPSATPTVQVRKAP